MEILTRSFIEWHVVSAPYLDNDETGDTGFVREVDNVALAVAVDALGHGAEAARVAAMAKGYLENVEETLPEAMMRGCNQVLRGTRGAAVCVARFDAEVDSLSWLSVGNIQGVHISVNDNESPRHASLIMRGGVVGDRLPELRSSNVTLKPGDMLVLATDGIGFNWHHEYRAGIRPVELANALLRNHCHGKDDAMVLAIRYDGLKKGSGA